MTKRLIALLLVACAMLCLVSCEEKLEAPDGYYVASLPDVDGCYFCVPTAWTSHRASGILTAYVSSLNTANVTVAFVETTHTTVSEYWSATEDAFLTSFDDGSYLLGKVDEVLIDDHVAYLYQYDGAYEGVNYRFLQYIIPMGEGLEDGLCILTCTASTDENIAGSNDFEDQYETFREMAGYFRFAESKPVLGEEIAFPEIEAPDGMKAACDPVLMGLTFFVPTAWRVNLTGGYINASHTDGSSVGVSSVDYEKAYDKMAYYKLELVDATKGFTLLDYWNVVQAEYGAYLQNFQILESPVKQEAGQGTTAEPHQAGDTTHYRFVMSGEVEGISYTMTLYVFRETDSRYNRFYTALYTAKTENHPTHEKEVEGMLGEVKY